MPRKKARPKARKDAQDRKIRMEEAARPKRRIPAEPARIMNMAEMEAILQRSGMLR